MTTVYHHVWGSLPYPAPALAFHACAARRMSRFARLFGFARTASRGPSWAEFRATTFTVVKAGCYIHVFREYVLEYSVVSPAAPCDAFGSALHGPAQTFTHTRPEQDKSCISTPAISSKSRASS